MAEPCVTVNWAFNLNTVIIRKIDKKNLIHVLLTCIVKESDHYEIQIYDNLYMIFFLWYSIILISLNLNKVDNNWSDLSEFNIKVS